MHLQPPDTYYLQVFPDVVANQNHSLHFNIDNRHDWIMEQALQCFREHLSHNTSSRACTPATVNEWEGNQVEILEEYRNFVRLLYLLVG